jgi:glycosyltransferase involved in cell wall biosynthesis
MEIVFIDSEPPAFSGGGIRTYLNLCLKICQEHGYRTKIYTHNAHAYQKENTFAIGRKPFLKWPWRGLAYRIQYAQNVLWEHANWLNMELENNHTPDKIYEFADFLGYGFFALGNSVLKNHIIIRVHTPNFLVPYNGRQVFSRLSLWQCGWREKHCLTMAKYITVPSAEFMHEKLPGLKQWRHIPNPLPAIPGNRYSMQQSKPCHFLFIGRVEPRKGVLPLVRNFIKFASEQPSVTLTLVGGAVDGRYSKQVRDLIRSQTPSIRSRLEWKDPVSAADIPSLLTHYQVLLVPSLWENSPYVYFEAMAAGLICIGTATGEMKATARITGAPTVRPGHERDWLAALRSVFNTDGEMLLAEQAKYLSSHKDEIPRLQLEFYRQVAAS